MCSLQWRGTRLLVFRTLASPCFEQSSFQFEYCGKLFSNCILLQEHPPSCCFGWAEIFILWPNLFYHFDFFVFRNTKQSLSWRPRWNRKFERKHYHLVITTRNAWLIFENRNQFEQNIRQRWYCLEIWQRLNCILPRKHLSLASCFFYQFRDLICSISSIFGL